MNLSEYALYCRVSLAPRCGNRCSLLVRKPVHGVFGEPYAIGFARVMRSHAAAVPAEDRLELGDCGAVLGGAGRRDLAHTMCGAWDAGCAARLAEFVAGGLFC
jgi:hypothetical protein